MANQSNIVGLSGHDGIPYLRQHHDGLYEAPNGKLYYGKGKVCEVGYDSDGSGSIYFRVRPLVGYEREGEYEFRDIVTNQPMPGKYYTKPLPLGKPSRFEPPPYELERVPKLGEEAFGCYITPDRMLYRGVGRVIAMYREISPFAPYDRTIEIHVQPIAGKTGEEYRFHDPHFQTYMHDKNLPSAPYPEDTEKKGKRTGKVPSMSEHPRLGTEDYGVYIAPNGQWYRGLGRVVRIGVNAMETIYAYVEPIPGKRGGDYDFFHPVTRDWMPDDQVPGAGEDASML